MNQMALQVLEVSKISFVWSEKEKEIKNMKLCLVESASCWFKKGFTQITGEAHSSPNVSMYTVMKAIIISGQLY